MSKIVIDRGVTHDDEFTPQRPVIFTTSINPELLQDFGSSPDAKEQLVEIMTDDYRQMIRIAIDNCLQHGGKQIIIDRNKKMKNKPVINPAGTAALSFDIQESTVLTIRGKSDCE